MFSLSYARLQHGKGTVDRHLKCQTCGGNNDDCPGHFGHLELTKPMYHAGFYDYLIQVLKCICLHCSSPLFHDVVFFFFFYLSVLSLSLSPLLDTHALALTHHHLSSRIVQKDDRVPTVLRIRNPVKRLSELVKICDGVKVCGQFKASSENKEGEEDGSEQPKIENLGCGHPRPKTIRKEQLNIWLTYVGGGGAEKRKVFLFFPPAFPLFHARLSSCSKPSVGETDGRKSARSLGQSARRGL